MYLSIGNGTTTVVLSGTAPVVGCTYFPVSPTMKNGTYEDVTESGEVVLRGTEASIRATVNGVERLFEQAARRQAGELTQRVYAEYRPVASDALWRSEILEGRVTWSENPGLRRLKDTNPTVKIGVFWRRRFFWEGAETEVQLSTSGSGAALGGKILTNHDDSGTGHDNWVQVAGAQTTGVLPAGVRVGLYNVMGSAQTYRRVFLAVNALSDPGNFIHILEAENRLSGGTVQSDASASNGSRVSFTLSNSSVTLAWTLPAATLQRAAGRLFRLLAAVLSASGSPVGTVTPRIRDGANLNTLWRGETVAMPSASGILDIGTLPLPPGGYSSGYGALTLTLAFTGTGTWLLDFLQLTPTDSLVIAAGLAPTPNNAGVIVDSIDGRSYVVNTDSTQYGYVAVSGGPLLLRPGALQRLILLCETDNGFDPAMLTLVQVWYRPRRLAV